MLSLHDQPIDYSFIINSKFPVSLTQLPLKHTRTHIHGPRVDVDDNGNL